MAEERGTRPQIKRHRRFTWAYLFGAICAAPASPWSCRLLTLDGAGWHSSPNVIMPENNVLPPPPDMLELIPAENIQDYLPGNTLGNRGLDTTKQSSAPGTLRWQNPPSPLNRNQRIGKGQDLGRLVLEPTPEIVTLSLKERINSQLQSMVYQCTNAGMKSNAAPKAL